MFSHSQKEPEPTEESGFMPSLPSGCLNPEMGAASAEMSPVAKGENAAIDVPLFALQQALMQRREALPKIYLRAGLFTALGALPVWMVTYTTSFSLIFLGLLAASDINPLVALSRNNKKVQEAVNALANTEDLRAVGPLAEALSPWDSSSAVALSRLLPRLQPSDADLLNERQRNRLRRAIAQNTNRFLFWRTDPIFADVLHRALTTVGALPSVEQTTDENVAEPHSSQVEGLLQLFQDAVRQRRKNTFTMGVAAGVSAAFAVVNLLTLLHPLHNNVLIDVAIGALGLTLTLSFRGLFRLKGLMKELANVSDLRIAGPLVEIVALEDGTAKTMAAQLLCGLLPRFRASDAKLLTEAQHAALIRTLSRDDATPNFFVAALKALEQIGDARALPVVESLATGRRVTTDPTRVQAAAQDCLPFLQIRCDQQRASQTLLRASSPWETATDTLLRPVQGVGETDPAELLRAGMSPPESD